MVNHKGRPPRVNPNIMSKTMTDNPDSEDRGSFETTREPERTTREIEVRARDDFYDLPDLDNFDYNADTRVLQLSAPPPRVDARWGKMRQHWVAFKHNNGHRIKQLSDRGYRVRRPETVPPSFQGFTEQWQGHDVIMVAGEHILMEIPETHYLKLQQVKFQENNKKLRDIQSTHGQIVRDGVVQDMRDRNAGSFSKEIIVDRGTSGGDVSFAD